MASLRQVCISITVVIFFLNAIFVLRPDAPAARVTMR
jgi:hypothetical protein